MEFFIIYLLVQIETIATMFSHVTLFLILTGVLGTILWVLVCCFYAESHNTDYFKDVINYPTSLKMRKMFMTMFFCGMALFPVSYLLPSQKNMAIIVGSGMVYNALTSETGQRLGNKAVQLLEKKVEEILSTENKKIDENSKKPVESSAQDKEA